MRKALVTGATGFIGSYVVEALLANKWKVIATSSSRSKAVTFSWYADVTYIEFDFHGFEDSVNYYKFFQEPDIMIHLAWQGLPDYKADFHQTVNLPRDKVFLDNLTRNGLKDLTVTGTCFEYGMKDGSLREDMPAEPANSYAIAKNDLRVFLEDMASRNRMSLKWIRLFYMYGRGQNPKSLLSQLDRALAAGETVFNMSGGEQVRDYLPVEEVAAGIVDIAAQDTETGIINCCSGRPVTVKQFVLDYLAGKGQQIVLNLGFYPYPDYEPMAFWGDNTKFKSIKQMSSAMPGDV